MKLFLFYFVNNNINLKKKLIKIWKIWNQFTVSLLNILISSSDDNEASKNEVSYIFSDVWFGTNENFYK